MFGKFWVERERTHCQLMHVSPVCSTFRLLWAAAFQHSIRWCWLLEKWKRTRIWFLSCKWLFLYFRIIVHWPYHVHRSTDWLYIRQASRFQPNCNSHFQQIDSIYIFVFGLSPLRCIRTATLLVRQSKNKAIRKMVFSLAFFLLHHPHLIQSAFAVYFVKMTKRLISAFCVCECVRVSGQYKTTFDASWSRKFILSIAINVDMHVEWYENSARFCRYRIRTENVINFRFSCNSSSTRCVLHAVDLSVGTKSSQYMLNEYESIHRQWYFVLSKVPFAYTATSSAHTQTQNIFECTVPIQCRTRVINFEAGTYAKLRTRKSAPPF